MPSGIYNHKLHSEETKEKMSKAKKGKMPNNFKGGMSQRKEYKREYLLKIRNATLEVLGGKCMKCGFSDKRALQIDHINGGGGKDRKEQSGNFNKQVLKSFLKKENKYQLLCANCNWIKRYENNENKK